MYTYIHYVTCTHIYIMSQLCHKKSLCHTALRSTSKSQVKSRTYHVCIHMHTYIHTYMHTYIHAHMPISADSSRKATRRRLLTFSHRPPPSPRARMRKQERQISAMPAITAYGACAEKRNTGPCQPQHDATRSESVSAFLIRFLTRSMKASRTFVPSLAFASRKSHSSCPSDRSTKLAALAMVNKSHLLATRHIDAPSGVLLRAWHISRALVFSSANVEGSVTSYTSSRQCPFR
jgi:hypothetical protein